jgi:hypothetical protein
MALFNERMFVQRDQGNAVERVTTAGALNDVSSNNHSTMAFTLATSITGFAGHFDGKELEVINENTVDLNIVNQSTSSSAGNRIITPTGADVAVPPSSGIRLRYVSALSRWVFVGFAGGGDALKITVTQSSHGFSVGNVLYYDGSVYALADANGTIETASDVVGIVESVVNANTFVLLLQGEITTLSGLTAGAIYYLSTTAGALSTTLTYNNPNSNTLVPAYKVPLLTATSTTGGIFRPQLKTLPYYDVSTNYLVSTNGLNALKAVSNGTVSATGNRATSDADNWASTNVANISLSLTSAEDVRGYQAYTLTGTGTSATGGTFIESPMFQLAENDLGKPISVSMEVNGATLDAIDIAIVVYNSSGTYQTTLPISGGTASTATVPSSELPTGFTKFVGYFIARSTDDEYYALRIRKLATSNLNFASLYVGPQQILQGAAIGDWVALGATTAGNAQASNRFQWGATTTAPTLSGTQTFNEAYYRYVGDSVEFSLSYGHSVAGSAGSGTYEFYLPSGFTIDTTKLANTGGQNFRASCGIISISDNSTTNIAGSVSANSATKVRFAMANSAGDFSSATTPNVGSTTLRMTMTFRVPIVGRSSNVTIANRAVEEYAFNTTNATGAGTNNTSNIGYGPGGTPILAYNSTTTTGESKTSFDVEWTTPIQVTDQVFAEINDGNGWAPATLRLPPVTSNNSAYGITLIALSATRHRILFGNAGYSPSTAATYAAAGAAWSGLTSWRWRVRKVSGGAVVGYPIATTNVYTTDNVSVISSDNAASLNAVTTYTFKPFSMIQTTLVTGASQDIFRFLLNGTRVSNNGVVGHFYVQVTDNAVGSNCSSYVFAVNSSGNGVGAGTVLTSVASSVRGTNPFAAAPVLAADGVGGAIKLQASQNGAIQGKCSVTFIGMVSTV